MALDYVQSNTLYQAGSGNIIGATSIVLTSLTDIYGNVLTMASFGAIGYITLEPDTTNEEAAIFTGITANANGTYTLTGVSTILAQTPYTATSGLVRQHSGGTKVVITDNVAFWATFANLNNLNTFAILPQSSATPLDANDFATKSYADGLALASAVAATPSTVGYAKLSQTSGTPTAPVVIETNDPRVNNYAADTGTANAYAIALTTAPSAYAAGQIYTFTVLHANTGASTLNVNSLGTKNIFNKYSALLGGEMLAGQIVMVQYDGTQFQMISPSPSTIPTGVISPYSAFVAPLGWLLCNGAAVSRTTYASLFNLVNPSLGTVTITIATPGVVSLAAHGMQTGDAVFLTTTGALPTGLSVNTQYWVVYVGTGTFSLATTLANALAGTKITTSGSQSGTHTLFRCPYGVGDGSTTFNTPNLVGNVPVGLNTGDVNFAGVGQSGGEETHTLTIAEMPAHTHTYSLNTGGSASVSEGTSQNNGSTPNTGSTGGGDAHNNLQPYISLNYIIKT